MLISHWKKGLVLSAAFGLFFAVVANKAGGQVIDAGNTPILGSSNTISAEPRLATHADSDCTVTLFSDLEFADYNTKNFTYTPPKNCPGPWSKVVFTADFTVTAGRQYDRTGQFYVGGANVFFGTTAEPRQDLSPYWHVENDVTDLSATFKTPQPGTAILGNFVGVYNGVTYNGIIYSTAKLVFYPVTGSAPQPEVPDMVIGIPGNNGAATLNTTDSHVVQKVNLPTNVKAAYLDVIAQSQINDEFWYLCVPNDLASELESCGNTGFRETEITIDKIPAGVAPIYPWIYTGGIDPYLWEPIPGVQTLNFKAFRVDLTPFAGVLSNGKPHEVGISVYNANGYFSAEGNLLVYTDKGTSQVTGEISSNTLAAEPSPVIANNITVDSGGNVGGYVSVSSARNYSIQGVNHTSQGDVTVQVDGKLNFDNTQHFVIAGPVYEQNLVQSTEGTINTTTTVNGVATKTGQVISYPFSFDYDQYQNADGTYTIYNLSQQKYLNAETEVAPGQGLLSFSLHSKTDPPPYVVYTTDEVASDNILYLDSSGNLTGQSGHSSQDYVTWNSDGYCYSREIKSNQSVITGYLDGEACKTIK